MFMQFPAFAASFILCFSAVVALEQLEALDLVQWLRSGAAAARRLHCDESSITRRTRASLKALVLKLSRGSELGWWGMPPSWICSGSFTSRLAF